MYVSVYSLFILAEALLNFDGKATLSGVKDISQISQITSGWYNHKKPLID